MAKVVVLGIDGGTFDLLDPWIGQGQLPTLAALKDSGTSGELLSTCPPLTCPAWWSFSTGKNPGRFGSYHFWQLAPRSYQIRRCKSLGPRRCSEIWDLVNEAGRRSGIINNPIMFPPARVRGYSVAGCFASARSTYTHPPWFKEVLDRLCGPGGYELDAVSGRRQSDDELVLSCFRVLEKRRKVIAHLLSCRDRPDFFLAVLTESDRICHRLLNRMDEGGERGRMAAATLLDFFKALDRAIGDMISRLDSSDYLFVMSDHGFGVRKRGFYINEWLQREGCLKLRRSALAGNLKRGLRRGFCRAAGGLNLNDLIKAKVPRRVLCSLAPAGDQEGQGLPVYDFIQNGMIDWSRTKAVALQDGLIYINTFDRPKGTVPLGGGYESLRRSLIKRLGGLWDSELNRCLKTEVLRREEIYAGGFLKEAPDLYLSIENYRVAAFPNIRSSNSKKSGCAGLTTPLALAGHRPEGMLMACGPGIKRGAVLKGARIIDLAPTVLSLMRIPVPHDMDGRILTGLFESGFKRKNIFATRPAAVLKGRLSYEPQTDEPIIPGQLLEQRGQRSSSSFELQRDEDIIQNRLRDLGYL